MILTQVTAAETEINPLVPHVPEIILGVIVIALLFVGVAKFIVPNFEKAYADRTAAIEGGIENANAKQAEADAKLAQLEAQLADARHEAARIREQAREEGAHHRSGGADERVLDDERRRQDVAVPGIRHVGRH